MFPRQDSTKDQMADVRREAIKRGMADAVSWMDAWDAKHSVNPEDFEVIVKIAREMGCYDAEDALHRLYRTSHDS